MGYSFKTLNNFQRFAFEPPYDVSDPEVYVSLGDLYDQNGPDAVYVVRGAYINRKGKIANKLTGEIESPVVFLDDFPVNVPGHQIEAIRTICSDEAAIDAVDHGQCKFRIREYHKKEFTGDFYSIEFL